jgi:hypothetical protein
MSWSIVIVIAIAAAVAYFVWKQRGKGSDVPMTTAARTPPSAGQGTSAGASPAAAGHARASSFEEYRRLSPSNMINGRLTCNRCGSNLIQAQGGSATCTTCGSILYGAR